MKTKNDSMQTTTEGKRVHDEKYLIFVGLMFVFIVLFFATAVVTHGSSMMFYFHTDRNDSYMDYFNSMFWGTAGADPYADYNQPYPALVYVILKILHRLVPVSVDNSFSLRTTMEAQVGFLVFMMICLVCIWELTKFSARYVDDKYTFLFAASILFCGPMLFTIERGNLILLSFLLSMAFVLFYDSPSRRFRYIAYVCLAMAAAIKIYPALLGFLVVFKKRYKECLFLVLLGLLFFIVPFGIFDGMDSIMTMLAGISSLSSSALSQGFGLNFSFTNLVAIVYAAIVGEYLSFVPSWLMLIPVIVGVLILFLNDETWKRMFALTLLMVWVPVFSYTYTLLFFILPLIIFLNEGKGRFDRIYALLFVFILAPWGLPKVNFINQVVEYEFKYPLTWGGIITNIAIMGFACVLLVDGCLNKYMHWR